MTTGDNEPRTWPRLNGAPDDLKAVRVDSSGSVFRRMDESGYFWSGRGWENGVDWSQLLRWGPLTEVFVDAEELSRP